jgi:sugar phosphate isomerase/epimerase
MYVGLLTTPFEGEPLEHAAAFAAEYGFGGLEIAAGPGSRHIDTDNFSKSDAERIRTLMERRALLITALAAYVDITHADPQIRERNCSTVAAAVEAASLLGVDTVCILAGLPPNGKAKSQALKEDVVQVLTPLLEKAAKLEVKLAVENWYATNLQHLGHFEQLFELLPQHNLGLNFDPSHLLWQDIDYIHAVERFADRIFHVHAKDASINETKRRWIGNQDRGWWSYVIPGLGRVNWGEFVHALRTNGYDGVLSIEHEDTAVSREEGFMLGKKYLEQFFIPSFFSAY